MWNSKYRARRTELAGYSFASKGEANCYLYLKALEQAGEVKILQTQVQVFLTDAKILFKPDFLVRDLKLDQDVYVEFKGFETPEYRIKRRLWQHYGPGLLRVYKGSGNAIRLFEEIKSKKIDNVNPIE